MTLSIPPGPLSAHAAKALSGLLRWYANAIGKQWVSPPLGQSWGAGGVPNIYLAGSRAAQVRNDSGAARAAGDVLRVTGVVGSPTTLTEGAWPLTPAFTGATPSGAWNRVVVLAGALAAGATGPCVLDGLAVCTVNVVDTDHLYAVPSNTVTKLTSAPFGPARILYVESSGTGDKECLVLLGDAPPQKQRATMSGSLSAGGSGSATLAATGETVTVWDWLLKSGQTVAGGIKVTVFFDPSDGKWYVDAAQCD